MKKETKGLDRWTRKQLIAGRLLNLKPNVRRICIKHRCEVRGMNSVKECCAAELRTIDFYL